MHTLRRVDGSRDDAQTAYLEAESVKIIEGGERKSLGLGEILDLEAKSKGLVDMFGNAVNSVLDEEENDRG